MVSTKSTKGFTLIELLVVISIIGILASLVFINVTTSLARARDAKRKSDIGEIQKALQLYYNDNGKYPLVGGCCQDISNVLNLLVPNYIKELPKEPRYDGSYYLRYNYDNTGGCNSDSDTAQTYRLWAWLENKNDPNGTGSCGQRTGTPYVENGTHLIYMLTP